MITRREMMALLAQAIASRQLLARNASRKLDDWVRAHDDLARKLHAKSIGGAQWQRNVEELSASIELAEILRGIDFAKLERDFRFTTDGGTKQVLRVSDQRLMFGAAIFGLEKNKAITPHGHRHMVSAHLVLSGSLRVRNFDRIADEETHLTLRPTVDDVIAPGACSTMSTERNNVHWFVAKTARAFTLDAVVSDLTEGARSYAIDLVDPRGGTKLPNGDVRAPRIAWKESVRLYGEE